MGMISKSVFAFQCTVERLFETGARIYMWTYTSKQVRSESLFENAFRVSQDESA